MTKSVRTTMFFDADLLHVIRTESAALGVTQKQFLQFCVEIGVAKVEADGGMLRKRVVSTAHVSPTTTTRAAIPAHTTAPDDVDADDLAAIMEAADL